MYFVPNFKYQICFILSFFQVSELLGTRNIQIASSGVVIGPNGVAPEEIENLHPSKGP